jgi:hypothetical protein
MEDVIREEMDSYQRKSWTVRLPDPSRSQAFEVCTLEDPDEWWTYQRKIAVGSDVLTWKHVNTDPTYFQSQTTSCVNFP